jgi:hypothetical protein
MKFVLHSRLSFPFSIDEKLCSGSGSVVVGETFGLSRFGFRRAEAILAATTLTHGSRRRLEIFRRYPAPTHPGGLASRFGWLKLFRSSGTRLLMERFGAINLAPLCGRWQGASLESEQVGARVLKQPLTRGNSARPKAMSELSFDMSRFTDSSDSQATASGPQATAARG